VHLIYTALQNYFCISTESKDLTCNIDLHCSLEYGHWKDLMVNKIEEEKVSKVITMYKIAYHEQVAKVSSKRYNNVQVGVHVQNIYSSTVVLADEWLHFCSHHNTTGTGCKALVFFFITL
jgi:hypothetical protein